MKKILPLMIAALFSAPFGPAPAATTVSCQEECRQSAVPAMCPYACPTNTCGVTISGSSQCCSCSKQGVSPRGCRFER